jgi:hypothetical protein
MFQPIRTDLPPDQVRRITFVPFLTDGRCVLIDEPGDPALPSGEVLDGEHYLLDTVLRVPLQKAGFRYQRFHPFGLDRDHLYAWIEGSPAAHHRGDRRRRDVPGRRLCQRAADGVGGGLVCRTRPGHRALRCRHIACAGPTRPASAAPVGRSHLGRQRRELAAARSHRLDYRAVSPADGIVAGHFGWWSFLSRQRA